MKAKFALLAAAGLITLAACSSPTPAPQPTAKPAQPTSPPAAEAAKPATATPAPVAAPPTNTAAPTAIPPTATPSAPKVLRIGWPAPPSDFETGGLALDPQMTYFSNEISMLSLIYEGLLKRDANNQIVAAAAESWKSGANTAEWFFTLKKGLKYSDGAVLNAKRFEYSIERMLDPAVQSPSTSAFGSTFFGEDKWLEAADAAANEKDAAKKKAADAAAKTAGDAVRGAIEALDASGKPCADYKQEDCLTLRIRLAGETPNFPALMTYYTTYPAKEESIAKGKTWYRDETALAGNGPYVIKGLDSQGKSFFDANPNYAGARPKVTRIEIYGYKDMYKGMSAYRANRVDMLSFFGSKDEYHTLKNMPDLMKELQSYPGTCSYMLGYRQVQKPFDDPKVRQAFSYGLDRTRLVNQGFGDFSKAYSGWIPPALPGGNPNEKRFAYDVEKARALIAESSYKSVAGLPAIQMLHSDYGDNNALFDVIVGLYKETFPGLKISHKGLPFEQVGAKLSDPKSGVGMYQTNNCSDVGDISEWAAYWSKGSAASQRTGFASAKFDELVAQAEKETDAAKRVDLFTQANDELIAQQPAAFTAVFATDALVKPWVKGIKTNARDVWPGEIDKVSTDIDMAAVEPLKAAIPIIAPISDFAATNVYTLNTTFIGKTIDEPKIDVVQLTVERVELSATQMRVVMKARFLRDANMIKKTVETPNVFVMDGATKLAPVKFEGLFADDYLAHMGDEQEGAVIFPRPKGTSLSLIYPNSSGANIVLK